MSGDLETTKEEQSLFKVLVERFYVMIYRCCLRIVNGFTNAKLVRRH